MVALMRSLCFSFIVLASIATLFSVADAHKFQVGGKGDWVEKPHEGYNSWAESKRFKVHDTLHFKYAKGSDSVQVVAKGDYDACNVNNPIEKFDNGNTEIALNRSGPFYFISGNQEHCTKGQKLIVFVLAIRNQPKVPISPAKAPSTAQPPKSHSPVVAPAKAPSTAHSPKSHSPISPVAPAKAPSTAKSPTAHSPASHISPAASHISPAKAPSTAQPPKAHSPVSPTAPAKAPTMAHSPKSSVSPSPHPVAHSPAVSPSKAPATSPAKHSPSPSPTNSPRSSPATPPKHSPSTPEKPPKSTPASPAPEKTPPSSPTPSDNNMAPAPSPSAATVVTVTSVMSTLFTVAFTVSMFA
ncbi:hypothetical protein HID58_046398 [Brassica napus]|uniref:Phytocyanin domain-containing protein n=1 Tax=Brassica napus TaxID=3708 RepID=A0ABQ8AXS0_BRANA|nr:early nodulin-like protein 2 [Brassica napus]KAH0896830.1 hypothetical protein HID58_046398 [Brassica napus]